jgi:hypothetical protein
MSFSFPLLIIISALLSIHISMPHEVCDSLDQVAHYCTLSPKSEVFVSDPALGQVQNKCSFTFLKYELRVTFPTLNLHTARSSIFSENYCVGPSSKTLQRMQKLCCGWWQRESAFQNENVDQVHVCSVHRVYMLISFSFLGITKWKCNSLRANFVHVI